MPRRSPGRSASSSRRSAPVVCVFDDLHWAEPTFLDLVEHLADWSRDAPILLVCIARPELLDRRPTWAGGSSTRRRSSSSRSTADETDELIERLLGDAALDERCARGSARRPRGIRSSSSRCWRWSPSRRTATSSCRRRSRRCWRRASTSSTPAERDVLERGAVEGNVFHRGGVEALAPEEPDVPTSLMALVRKELVRPDRAQLPGDDAFRFRHLLIRDAAYDGAAEGRARGAARALRRLARDARHRARRVRRDPRLPPRAGASLPRRARAPREETDELAGAPRSGSLPRRSAPLSATTSLPRSFSTNAPSLWFRTARRARMAAATHPFAYSLRRSRRSSSRGGRTRRGARQDGDRPRELRVWLARSGRASHRIAPPTRRPLAEERSRSSKPLTTTRVWPLPGHSSQASSSGAPWRRRRSPQTARSSTPSARATSCCSKK